MGFFQSKAVFMIFAAMLFTSCSANNSNSNTETNANKQKIVSSNADSTKDDIDDFAKIIKLPFLPEEVSWRETADKKIIAVLKFSSAEAVNLITQIEKQKPAVNSEINAENWFPPELIAQSQQSGDDTLKGKEYAANDFFLAPYTKGKITRIDETNYFILELSAT